MINKEKLEEILIRNWANFFDIKKMISRVLQDVDASFNTFDITKEKNTGSGVMQISLSRFHLIEDGFILWVEFAVPKNNDISIGTIEYVLSSNNIIKIKQITGKRFKKSE